MQIKINLTQPRTISIDFCCIELCYALCKDKIPTLVIDTPFSDKYPASWREFMSLQTNKILGQKIREYKFCPFCGALISCKGEPKCP